MASMQISQSHNTPGARPVNLTMDLEDRIMTALPKSLADWLRYEATADTDPVAIFKEWRAGLAGGSALEGGEGLTEGQLLSSLRSINRDKTRRTYGRMHPQASF